MGGHPLAARARALHGAPDAPAFFARLAALARRYERWARRCGRFV